MTDTHIADLWHRIEAWLAAHAPDALRHLPQGASETSIQAAERTLGYALPPDLVSFLLVHDGSGDLWLHDLGVFMSLETTLACWDTEVDLWGDGANDEWARPTGPIKGHWFTRMWLPILDTWSGDYVCIDLDPPEDGTHGQLISWFHDGGPRRVEAASFTSLLLAFVESLEAGHYTAILDRQGRPYLELRSAGGA